MRQRASRRDTADVNSQGEETTPTWDDKPDDMEASVDISTSIRYEFAVPRGIRASALSELGSRAMH